MTNLQFKFEKDSKVCKCLATTLGPFVGVYVNNIPTYLADMCVSKNMENVFI